jgi:hypothetical protein
MKKTVGRLCGPYSAWVVISAGMLLVLGMSRPARAQFMETNYTITLQSDIRYTVQEKTKLERIPGAEIGRNPWLRGETHRRVTLVPHGVSRNENLVKLKVSTEVKKLRGVAEVDLVWLGYARDMENLGDLTKRGTLDPFRIECHALYLDVTGFVFDKLDLRIGQQVINWGTADQFNPTSNMNPLDLEDRLLFGDRVALPMVRFDLAIAKSWRLTAAWSPIFRPHLLPTTAPLGLSSPDRIPVVSDADRHALIVQRKLGEVAASGPTRVTEAAVIMPDHAIKNSQAGIRLRGRVGNQDISFSYYYGRSRMPQPVYTHAHLDTEKTIIDTKVNLYFPRMHVVGFDMGGQIPWLKSLKKKFKSLQPVGWWFEAAAFFPQKLNLAVYQSGFSMFGLEDGELDYGVFSIDGRPTVVDDTPFLKWVVGFDYTFSKSWYANVQWIHGFPDEFGAGGWLADLWAKQNGYIVGKAYVDEPSLGILECLNSIEQCAHEFVRPRLGDYLVSGVDFKFYKEQMMVRLFFILDLRGVYETYWKADSSPAGGRRVRKWHHPFSAKGYSAMIYPKFAWSVGPGAEISAGGLIMLGKNYSKFGDPAAGSSMVWARGKFAF